MTKSIFIILGAIFLLSIALIFILSVPDMEYHEVPSPGVDWDYQDWRK